METLRYSSASEDCWKLLLGVIMCGLRERSTVCPSIIRPRSSCSSLQTRPQPFDFALKQHERQAPN